MRLSTSSGAIGWLLAAVMLALLSGCGSAGSSSSTGSSTPAAAARPRWAHPSPSAPLTAASRPASAGPLRPVERYWGAIASHHFEAAYRDLAAGSNAQSEGTFVSAEQRSQIQSANFSGSVTSASENTATVAVDSLTTTDGPYGCRRWSGSYQLIRPERSWRIVRASIAPSPCQDTGTTGNTGILPAPPATSATGTRQPGPATPAPSAPPATPAIRAAAGAPRLPTQAAATHRVSTAGTLTTVSVE